MQHVPWVAMLIAPSSGAAYNSFLYGVQPCVPSLCSLRCCSLGKWLKSFVFFVGISWFCWWWWVFTQWRTDGFHWRIFLPVGDWRCVRGRFLPDRRVQSQQPKWGTIFLIPLNRSTSVVMQCVVEPKVLKAKKTNTAPSCLIFKHLYFL